MSSDYTLSRYIQSTKHLDYGNGIWASPQTLGCRDNFVKPHIHTAIEILYFMKGIHRVIVDGVEYTAYPGDMALFRSNSLHEVYNISDGRCTHFVLQLSPAHVISFSSEEHGSSYLLKLSLGCKNEKAFWTKEECEANGLSECFGELINQEAEGDRFSDITTKILSSRVLLIILRELFLEDTAEDTDEDVSGCIYNAIVYINGHYMENITADICAKKVFMSYGHFSRSFKKATGANFKDYLNTIRLIRAERALIATDDTIAEICRDCGFNTVSYFIATFRRNKGMTPAVYREKHRQGSKRCEISEDKQ
ncbi:MAG: helix-turn-helix domain-containing protein [Clostridia bacterium]|nr:helix-turn-helix domain-containing protein [Clostridia bacterium]